MKRAREPLVWEPVTAADRFGDDVPLVSIDLAQLDCGDDDFDAEHGDGGAGAGKTAADAALAADMLGSAAAAPSRAGLLAACECAIFDGFDRACASFAIGEPLPAALRRNAVYAAYDLAVAARRAQLLALGGEAEEAGEALEEENVGDEQEVTAVEEAKDGTKVEGEGEGKEESEEK